MTCLNDEFITHRHVSGSHVSLVVYVILSVSVSIDPISIASTNHEIDKSSSVPRVLETQHLHLGLIKLEPRWTISVNRIAVKLTLWSSRLSDFTDGCR